MINENVTPKGRKQELINSRKCHLQKAQVKMYQRKTTNDTSSLAGNQGKMRP